MGIQPTCTAVRRYTRDDVQLRRLTNLDQFGMSGCAFWDMGKPRICSYMFNNLRGESPIHLLFLGKLSHFTNQKSAIYLNNLKILRFIDYQIKFTLTYRPLWWACPFIDLPTFINFDLPALVLPNPKSLLSLLCHNTDMESLQSSAELSLTAVHWSVPSPEDT